MGGGFPSIRSLGDWMSLTTPSQPPRGQASGRMIKTAVLIRGRPHRHTLLRSAPLICQGSWDNPNGGGGKGNADKTKPKHSTAQAAFWARARTQRKQNKKQTRTKKWLGKIPWTSALGVFLWLGLLHWLCCCSVAETEKQMV